MTGLLNTSVSWS